MKPKILLRIASGLTLFFAAGHTMGHMGRYDVADPKAQEVVRAMAGTQYDLFGQLRTYDENYTGMSLNLIFTLLAFTVVLWLLANQSTRDAKATRALLIPVLLCLLGFAVTSYLYFFPVPAITSLLAAMLIAISVVQLGKRTV